jgi:WD40-like Beta Propeller Repeat
VKRLAISAVVACLMGACTSGGSSSSSSPTTPPTRTSSFASLYERNGTIFVREVDSSPVALTTGFLPVWSPDGTTIAFLRDPSAPHHRTGDPFVLQVWLIHPDGTGLRKLGLERGCCLGASPDLYWLQDGASIVLSGIHSHVINVATGASTPPSPANG